MSNDVLGNFYHRILPHYQPRAEALLSNTTANDLQKLTFRYIFTVDGMVTISHMIEDLIIRNKRIADAHVSFQYFSRITPQLERYQEVARASKKLWLYGVPDAPLPELTNTTFINTENTPLEHYWYVIAYGAGISATLLAEEITPENRMPGEPRIYEGFYTFEVDTAFQVLTVLHQLFPKEVPSPIIPEMLTE